MKEKTKNTLFFYKNVVFPVQAEYSYFSADFRLKIFLYYSSIIASDISVLEFIGVYVYVLHVPFKKKECTPTLDLDCLPFLLKSVLFSASAIANHEVMLQ